MKNELVFWSLFLWGFSLLLWGWLLTVRIRWIQDWFGGFAIVCNFFAGYVMCILLFSQPETSDVRGATSQLYEFMLGVSQLLFLFVPILVMGLLLKKSRQLFTIRENKPHDNLPEAGDIDSPRSL